MKRKNYTQGVLIGALLMLSFAAVASPYQERVTWQSEPSDITGLYSTRSHFSKQGISLGVHAMYYYGDADHPGVMFKGGFNPEDISGLATFSYHMPISTHWNMRFSLSGGLVRANSQKIFDKLGRDDYRQFQNIFVEPSIGFEWYPINRYGFFIYGGVSCTIGFINFDYWCYPSDGRGRTELKGKTNGYLPMIQGGLGYSWNLNQQWQISIQAMFQEGLYDTYYVNLDAYPMAAAQNDQGVKIGTPGGIRSSDGKYKPHWNDGWFQLGLTVTYHWRNCEQCRLLNNYEGQIKANKKKR